MATDSILNLVIDDRAHSYAKIYSSLLKDEFQRKRSYASLVALYGLVDALEKTDNDVQKSMTLFRNPILNEQYEISDLYVNNWHIDVRVLVEGEYCLIPKSHFDNDITPDFYAVIKVNKTLDKAELLGFATIDKVEKELVNNVYYYVNVNSLISYDEFISKINMPNIIPFSAEDHEKFRTSYLGLMDGEVDNNTKNELIRHLFKCAQCRTEFCCFTGFEMVSCNMSEYPNMLDDMTLSIIGAQDVDNAKYAGKEEVISIVDEEEKNEDEQNQKDKQNDENLNDNAKDETKELEEYPEEKEETVSDILDELFNMDEDVIDVDDDNEKTIDTSVEKNAPTSEVEIIEDDNETLDSYDYDENNLTENSEIEVIEDVNIEPYKDSDIEIIENTLDELNETNDDDSIVLIDSEPEKLLETKDIDIYKDENNNGIDDNLEIIDEAADIIEQVTDNSDDSVQKVIVDYDEFGEPIYSVVTNVPQDTDALEDDPTDINLEDESDEDLLNEEFEAYPEENDTTEDLTEIKNGAERTVEYVTNDDVTALDSIVEASDSINKEQNIEAKLNDVVKNQTDEEAEIEDIQDEEFDENNTNSESDIEYNEEEPVEEYVDDNSKEEELDELATDVTQEVQEEEYVESDESDEQETFEEYSDEEYEDEEYEDEETSDSIDNEEMDDDEPQPQKKKSGGIFASLLLLIVFAVLGTGAFMFFKNKNQVASSNTETTKEQVATEQIPSETVNDMFETPTEGIEIPNVEQDKQQAPQLDDSNLLPPPPPIEEEKSAPQIPVQKATKQNVDINSSIASAFSNPTNKVSLRGINWLCSPQLFSDPAFKTYMQGLDNVLKLNLRKNILDIVEPPKQSSVTVKFAVDNNGKLKKVLVSDSSGSKQVDNIVLQSINETFEGENGQILNDSAQKADMYYLKLVIKL